MTPTEQDKELRDAIISRLQHAYFNRHTDEIAGIDSHAPSILGYYADDIMQLITADRKRVALEARIDELEDLSPELYYFGDIVKVDNRIAELKAQQEEV